MCEVAADACRHAGSDPFNLPLRNAGVFIGHAQGSGLAGDYTYATCVEEAAQFLREVDDFQQPAAADQQEAVIGRADRRGPRQAAPPHARGARRCRQHASPARSAKAFGLSGPFLAINSACASSLQAMLLAARALQLGRIDMAIVGGASDCKSRFAGPVRPRPGDQRHRLAGPSTPTPTA